MPEVRLSDQPICDFCSEPKWGRTFHCPELRSKEEWLACSVCGSLIDRGKWDALLMRAVDRLSEKYEGLTVRRILTDTIKRSHDLFREHYKAKS